MKLNLSGFSCLFLLSVCPLFLQLCLCVCALMDIFTKFQDRMDRDTCFISSSSCCDPFHFLVLVPGWQVKLSSLSAAHPSLCWLHNLNREINNIERGWVVWAAILKKAVTLLKKKSVLTKINNQTNNQTTICSNVKDELLLGALCSFCDFWCHNVFLSFEFLFFFSLNYSSFEPHKHGSVAPGSPSEGRKKQPCNVQKRAS